MRTVEMERWDVGKTGTWVYDMIRQWTKQIHFYIFMSSFD
jgi:hypothetical protein